MHVVSTDLEYTTRLMIRVGVLDDGFVSGVAIVTPIPKKWRFPFGY